MAGECSGVKEAGGGEAGVSDEMASNEYGPWMMVTRKFRRKLATKGREETRRNGNPNRPKAKEKSQGFGISYTEIENLVFKHQDREDNG